MKIYDIINENTGHDIMVKHPQYGSEWEHATKMDGKKKHTYSSKERANAVAKNLMKGSSSQYAVAKSVKEQGVAEGLSKQFEIMYREQNGDRKRIIVSGTSKAAVARQFKKQYKLEIEQVKELQQSVAEDSEQTWAVTGTWTQRKYQTTPKTTTSKVVASSPEEAMRKYKSYMWSEYERKVTDMKVKPYTKQPTTFGTVEEQGVAEGKDFSGRGAEAEQLKRQGYPDSSVYAAKADYHQHYAKKHQGKNPEKYQHHLQQHLDYIDKMNQAVRKEKKGVAEGEYDDPRWEPREPDMSRKVDWDIEAERNKRGTEEESDKIVYIIDDNTNKVVLKFKSTGGYYGDVRHALKHGYDTEGGEYSIKWKRVQNETATAGATNAANIGTVVNPHISPGKARGKKSYTGSIATGSGTKAPPQPKVKQPKTSSGTAVNALDMKGNSIFGGGAVKR